MQPMSPSLHAGSLAARNRRGRRRICQTLQRFHSEHPPCVRCGEPSGRLSAPTQSPHAPDHSTDGSHERRSVPQTASKYPLHPWHESFSVDAKIVQRGADKVIIPPGEREVIVKPLFGVSRPSLTRLLGVRGTSIVTSFWIPESRFNQPAWFDCQAEDAKDTKLHPVYGEGRVRASKQPVSE